METTTLRATNRGAYTVKATFEHNQFSLTRKVRLQTNEKTMNCTLFELAVNKIYQDLTRDMNGSDRWMQLRLTSSAGESIQITDQYEQPDEMGLVWLKKMISKLEIERHDKIEKPTVDNDLSVSNWASGRFRNHKMTIRAYNRLRQHYRNKTIRTLVEDIQNGTFQHLRGIGKVTVDEIITAIREDFF